MNSLSLFARFEKIPDPRRPAGTRYSLASILALIVAAVLSGRTSLRAIARWGKTLTPAQLLELGIKRQRAPGQTAMHELLCRLPASEIEKAPGAWVGEFASAQASPQIVLDGKTLRASAGSEYPALHLLAAYCPQVGGVLAQLPADGKDNEITAAKAMLKALPVKGAVVTGDAMFCQRELCAAISSKDGDFLFVVKDNQPALVQDIEAAFSPPFSPKERLEREKSLSRHETVEKKHGRLEYRSLEATPILCGYLDKWPHVKQVFRLVRRRGTNEEMVAAQTPIVLHVPNDRFYCIV